MAKTLNKLVYSVLEVVNSFDITDDSKIDSRWVADQLITQNHSLLRKALRERRIDDMLYLTDSPLELHELESDVSVSGIDIRLGSDFCYADIKPLVTGLKGREIDFVSNLDYSTIFTRTSLRELVRGSSGYYQLNSHKYAVNGNRFYFRKKDLGTKFISVNAIWSDPRDVSSWTEDTPFPTPSERNLEVLTIQQVMTALGFPKDLINDAQEVYNQRVENNTKSDGKN